MTLNTTLLFSIFLGLIHQPIKKSNHGSPYPQAYKNPGCPFNTRACIPSSLPSFINLFSFGCTQKNQLYIIINFLTYGLLSDCHVSSTKNKWLNSG